MLIFNTFWSPREVAENGEAAILELILKRRKQLNKSRTHPDLDLRKNNVDVTFN